MSQEVKSLYHMITAWNAFAAPAVIPPSLLKNLSDYLASFLKSTEGEKYLNTLGYVRSDSAAPR
jgi:tripartite-type tricarboxylate transporter receptor subunit TctC